MDRDDVVIHTPCGADWDAMDPQGRARLCGMCDKLVHDLSGMPETEAAQLMSTTSESLCVRYLYDQTGKIWFVDELSKIVPPQRLNRRTRGLVVATALVAPLLFQACGGANANGGGYQPPSNQNDAGAPSADGGTESPP